MPANRIRASRSYVQWPARGRGPSFVEPKSSASCRSLRRLWTRWRATGSGWRATLHPKRFFENLSAPDSYREPLIFATAVSVLGNVISAAFEIPILPTAPESHLTWFLSLDTAREPLLYRAMPLVFLALIVYATYAR